VNCYASLGTTSLRHMGCGLCRFNLSCRWRWAGKFTPRYWMARMRLGRFHGWSVENKFCYPCRESGFCVLWLPNNLTPELKNLQISPKTENGVSHEDGIDIRFEVVRAIVMDVAIFWYIAPRSPYVNRRFKGGYHFHIRRRKSVRQETSAQQVARRSSHIIMTSRQFEQVP
jgi:hypothetical protein